ncbi:DNA-binding transcriptional regulator, MarR family [Goodfellowiella coeruleoviolacea]|uniref:DNA-binding transcriptional regulator, MarR family n=1 Tax=Goodfellowiella coeruleoviolacea TaxID=334858 RepID=A0AAE3GEM2_9PSEU|nr:DNA-binding transcriptional regulator, MarR family [Goodfellowiella coeruleoviolacea]
MVNLLGATALAVTDLLVAGAKTASGTSSSGAAALVLLHEENRLNVTELGRRVGLTQSAAARMVDGLEQRGLVTRRPTGSRWVSVHLTAAGRRVARQLLDSRNTEIAALVARLSLADQRTLATILEKLLTGIHHGVGNSDRICRLCDRGSCLRAGASCPVGQSRRRQAAQVGAHHDARAGEAVG